MRRLPLVLAAALALLGCVVAQAVAVPAAVTIDKAKPSFEKLEGGGWKATLGFTNLTSQPVNLSVASTRPKANDRCTVQFETGPTVALAPSEPGSAAVTYSPSCKIGKSGANLTISTDTSPAQTVAVAVGGPTDTPKPDWNVLWVFPILLALTALVLMIRLWTNENMTFGTPLPHLPETWSFSDSWASNVTVVGGVFTGIIGSSDVIKAFLGEEADSSIALATVGAAVAAAFIAFGGVVVQAIKDHETSDFTAGGFVLAAALTLAGAFGELYVMFRTGETLSLGGWEHRLLLPLVVAAFILVRYATTNIHATLELGTADDPPPIVLSEPTVAAVVVAKDCCGVDVDEALKAIKKRLSPPVKAKAAKRKLVTEKSGRARSILFRPLGIIPSTSVGETSREPEQYLYPRRVRSALL